MSLLGSIVSKILNPFGGSAEAKTADKPADAQPSSGGSAAPAPTSTSAPSSSSSGAGGSGGQPVDVEQVLNDMAAKNPQKLNWRTSIVDLMKLLDLDSSLHARQQLADELNYSGDKNDSAAMNVWLHKQVVRKLEENGGKVPADLKD